ncbi:MAG: hypothetical protein AB8G18_03800 [Gammaproteobacteria bacterium]
MFIRKFLAVATLALGFSTQAATTVEFTTPSGTAGPNDVIEVWLTLSTDTGFTFDPSDPDGDGSYGGVIDPADLPTGGFSFDANMGEGAFVEFDFIESAFASISAGCSGSFVVGTNGECGLGGVGTDNYNFNFGPGWSPGNNALELAAGDSIDFLWGAFTPVDGGAAEGTYDYFEAGFGLFFRGVGFDDFGEEVEVLTFIELGQACDAGDQSCAFSRTITAAPVPVPAAAWLFASALFGLAGMSRRRKV